MHLDDTVDALELCVEKRGQLEAEAVFNIGEARPVSYGEIQQATSNLLHGHDWTTLELPKLLAKAGAIVENAVSDSFIKPWMIDRADDHYELNIDKARQQLSWQPHYSLMATLPAIINNLKKDPADWYRANGLDVPAELAHKHE